MPLAECDLIDDPNLGLALLVENDLDRRVRWVHTTEPADSSRYLQGDEVILTTGVWIATGTRPADFVRPLQRSRIAALGYGLARPTRRYPPELETACRRCALTLFRVPFELPFIAIGEAFVERLASDRQVVLEASVERNAAFVRAAEHGEGLDGVLRVPSRSRPVHAWVIGPGRRVLARCGCDPCATVSVGSLAMHADTPRGDIVEEATNLLAAAAADGLPLRLIGGLAVQLHAPEGPHPAVARSSKDIDLVTTRGKGRQAAELMRRRGYQANEEFNAVNGHRRLLFYDLGNERQVDIFVGSFEMCHVIPVAERLALDPVTVPLAELLLTKLQVVRLNEKDQRDILALLHHHDVGDADGDVINGAYIGSLCSADWGLWRTSKMNLERSAEALTAYGFSDDERTLIAGRIDRLWGVIEGTPKSVKWKLRDRVGDRKQWYQDPEEVD